MNKEEEKEIQNRISPPNGEHSKEQESEIEEPEDRCIGADYIMTSDVFDNTTVFSFSVIISLTVFSPTIYRLYH